MFDIFTMAGLKVFLFDHVTHKVSDRYNQSVNITLHFQIYTSIFTR